MTKTREELRELGQFWTPAWVARAMVAYVEKRASVVFDPAVGKGAFFTALKQIDPEKKFYGLDVDPGIISEARSERIFTTKAKIDVKDFILQPPKATFGAIVANPPYIRHHRLSREYKTRFREVALRTVGNFLDGRAGLHIYFLLQALSMLAPRGRLAFIMPADTCEGVFARRLWDWISKKYRINAVVSFDYSATPFPGVDTNALIFLISNEVPAKTLKWARCYSSKSDDLFKFLNSDLRADKFATLDIIDRRLDEAILTGLSRKPRMHNQSDFLLADFARVMRGIVTGANEFFFLTKQQAKELGIPRKFLKTAIGRTRDVESAVLSNESVEVLESKGRPTQLFFPNGYAFDELPDSVQRYIKKGESLGLHTRVLISSKRPWYKMENREVPPFIFAYLGRRNTRFIKNEAKILPLTAFLCVYPHSGEQEYVDKLWQLLQSPEVLNNLHLVGKSYGSGAIKVEPRSLERLPISQDLVQQIGLRPVKRELTLFDLNQLSAESR